MNIKRYIEFIKESKSEWVERTVGIPVEDFFNRFYDGKVKIDEDDNYITYEFHDKSWDSAEDEYFWETKLLIKLDKAQTDNTHYFEKKIIDRPLYKIRDEKMTRSQELTIRTWVGTDKKPKSGSYLGYEKGLAKFKSGMSGNIFHVLPDGKIVEMLPEDERSDSNYINNIIDYLLDTKNFNLIDIVKNQSTK